MHPANYFKSRDNFTGFRDQKGPQDSLIVSRAALAELYGENYGRVLLAGRAQIFALADRPRSLRR